MSSAPPPITDRIADSLPGWMFAAVGVAMLAMVLLTPTVLESREVRWRLELMRAQAGALEDQSERYEQFAQAVAEDDPVVLERLALTHLRMTPVGKLPLSVRPVSQERGDIASWLAVAQPVIGRDVPELKEVDTRLTRLANGPARAALLAVGVVCLIGGVFFQPRSGRKTD